jgi:hypothetical protein
LQILFALEVLLVFGLNSRRLSDGADERKRIRSRREEQVSLRRGTSGSPCGLAVGNGLSCSARLKVRRRIDVEPVDVLDEPHASRHAGCHDAFPTWVVGHVDEVSQRVDRVLDRRINDGHEIDLRNFCLLQRIKRLGNVLYINRTFAFDATGRHQTVISTVDRVRVGCDLRPRTDVKDVNSNDFIRARD